MAFIFEVIGYVTVAVFALKTVSAILSRFVAGGVKPTAYGKWVVVTGATDGIGKAMCFEYASKGMNVFLISRTQSKLESVAEEITSKYPDVETQVLAIDYSNFDDSKISLVKSALEKLGGDLGILVNNVGMSYNFPVYFHELEDGKVSDLINLNVTSTTVMTKLVLPIFLAKEGKKKGAILNIGSFAGLYPSPLLAEYSAAKSYVEKLSSSLYYEYKDKGIDVQCHSPLYIVSKMSKFKKPTMFIPSPERYAKSVLSLTGGPPVVSGYWLQSIATFGIIDFIPESLMMKQTKGMHIAIRKKGLRKLEREREAKKDQ
mmetsp:Transcript_6887/g.7916  ORF Transcript_6887/g.7916 Transcript_6887/m.7916 type:complete len:316 (-) Transcript_6887:1795-2742(-)|eukprot:CAMPEP_0184013180 /NCGR_PEP_ID=MMETSP0954-20121128/4864_1 /TAXON_ID=627963 /ORGANISM="Aplanochytrium sp, Strain PBS07" /LENGTH=315 /DNA_ID=CAMNT_0026293329 /DNA_START=77 /DNA_END=1024 /DNA_ORIENTATION=+